MDEGFLYLLLGLSRSIVKSVWWLLVTLSGFAALLLGLTESSAVWIGLGAILIAASVLGIRRQNRKSIGED